MTSTLTKNQVKTFSKVFFEDGKEYLIVTKVRYDDECGNGHNTFSITGEKWRARNGVKIGGDCVAGGCIHEEIRKHFPELAPYLKWHLTSSDEPMYYIENTCYHVREHGPTHAWVYYTGYMDPSHIVAEEKEWLLGYVKASEAQRVEGQPGYRVHWDEKTSKVRNLEYARSYAVWPEATDSDLTDPGLEERLQARLPQLMVDFKAAVESLGFVY